MHIEFIYKDLVYKASLYYNCRLIKNMVWIKCEEEIPGIELNMIFVFEDDQWRCFMPSPQSNFIAQTCHMLCTWVTCIHPD